MSQKPTRTSGRKNSLIGRTEQIPLSREEVYQAVNLAQLREEHVEDLFDLYDQDRDGTIDKKEFSNLVKQTGQITEQVVSVALIDEFIAAEFGKADTDQSGRLSLDEFIGYWNNFRDWSSSQLQKSSGVNAEDLKLYSEIFSVIDLDHSHSISKDEIQHMIEVLGFEVTSTDLEDIFGGMDTDDSGRLDFNEFTRLMSGEVAGPITPERVREAFKKFMDKSKPAARLSVFHDEEDLEYLEEQENKDRDLNSSDLFTVENMVREVDWKYARIVDEMMREELPVGVVTVVRAMVLPMFAKCTLDSETFEKDDKLLHYLRTAGEKSVPFKEAKSFFLKAGEGVLLATKPNRKFEEHYEQLHNINMACNHTLILGLKDEFNDDGAKVHLPANFMAVKATNGRFDKCARVLGLVSPFGRNMKASGFHCWRPCNETEKEEWRSKATHEEMMTVNEAPLFYNPEMDYSLLIDYDRNLRDRRDVFMIHIDDVYEQLKITLFITVIKPPRPKLK